MANSRSSLYGESIFTSFRSLDGKVPQLDRHLGRLFDSVNHYYFNSRLELGQFYAYFLPQGIDPSLFPNHYFRLTFESELSPLSSGGIGMCDGKLNLEIKEMDFSQEEIALITSTSPFGKPAWTHKAGSYFESFKAKKDAIKRGANDALLLDDSGFVQEATTSRIVFYRENHFFTPDLDHAFEGLGLIQLEDFIVKKNKKLNKQKIHNRNLSSFESAFLVNSVKLISPVSRINQREFLVNTSFCNEYVDWLRKGN